MAILAACLLVEFACATTLVYCDAPGSAVLVALTMLAQAFFGVRRWNVEQMYRRHNLEISLVGLGKSVDEARMHAAYTYPDVRVFARLAADVLRSAGNRKEVL